MDALSKALGGIALGLALPLAALTPLVAGLLWTAGWMGLGHPQVTAVLYHSESYTQAARLPTICFAKSNAADGYER